MLSYFISTSPNALLKKAIGFSTPSTFFYSTTTATVSNEAKEKIKKYLD
jgi:hypothetical protein